MSADWGTFDPGAGAGRATWRAHSDAVNLRLIDDWLGGRAVARVLKTDLYDEATSEGLAAPFDGGERRFVGLDVSMPVVRGASRAHPAILAVRADVRALPFRAASFDAVLSISTLDHFGSRAEITRALEAIRAVLRPGGWLVLTLDNLANPKIRLRNALPRPVVAWTGLVPHAVGPSLGPRAARRRLARAGFEVVASRAILHCPRILAVAAARLPLFARDAARRRFLGALSSFEALERLPTRHLTAHYVAILARRPEDPCPVGRSSSGSDGDRNVRNPKGETR